VVAPDLSTTDVVLDQTASGRYEGDFVAVARGAYLVSVSEDGGHAATTSGAVSPYSPEFSIVAPDADLLALVSEKTGGQVIPSDDAAPGDLFEQRPTKTIPHEIWETLLLAALILLPIDVGFRRVAVTREQLAYAREWIQSKLRRRPQLIESTSPASITSLKQARSRVVLGEVNRDETQPHLRSSAAESPDQASEVLTSAQPEEDSQPLASRLLDAKRKRRG
jgi:hypothetical protein